MGKTIRDLSGHTIVCGGGDTGEHVVHELISTQRPFVLIERDEGRVAALVERLGTEFPVVIGDATEDDALHEAGVARASGLVACISSDKDNLIVTVSARLARPELRIVCRCIDERVEEKIRKAGADAVVSPNRIGGLRMISELVRPTAVSYLDLMLRDRERNLRVESTRVFPGAELDGATVGDLRLRGIEDLLILALREGEDAWVFAPPDERRISSEQSLVYMGGPRAREAIERLACPKG